MSLLNVAVNGKYYNPAHNHYGYETDVTCDSCRRSNLNQCIGFNDYDLCLTCADKLLQQTKSKVESKIIHPMNKTMNGSIKPILKRPQNISGQSSQLPIRNNIPIKKSVSYGGRHSYNHYDSDSDSDSDSESDDDSEYELDYNLTPNYGEFSQANVSVTHPEPYTKDMRYFMNKQFDQSHRNEQEKVNQQKRPNQNNRIYPNPPNKQRQQYEQSRQNNQDHSSQPSRRMGDDKLIPNEYFDDNDACMSVEPPSAKSKTKNNGSNNDFVRDLFQ